MPEIKKSSATIGNQEATPFSRTNSLHVDYYIPVGGKIYQVSTDRPDLLEVQQIRERLRIIVR